MPKTAMVQHYKVNDRVGQIDASAAISDWLNKGWNIAGMSTGVDGAAQIALTVLYVQKTNLHGDVL